MIGVARHGQSIHSCESPQIDQQTIQHLGLVLRYDRRSASSMKRFLNDGAPQPKSSGVRNLPLMFFRRFPEP